MLPEELPDRWHDAIRALIVLDGSLQERLQRVYVNPLRKDVMKPTLKFLREGGQKTMANKLNALESTLRRPVVKLNDLDAEKAVRLLVDVTHHVFRFHPDAVADEQPPDDDETQV